MVWNEERCAAVCAHGIVECPGGGHRSVGPADRVGPAVLRCRQPPLEADAQIRGGKRVRGERPALPQIFSQIHAP